MNVNLKLTAVIIPAPTLMDLILAVVGVDIHWLLTDILVKVRKCITNFIPYFQAKPHC